LTNSSNYLIIIYNDTENIWPHLSFELTATKRELHQTGGAT